MADVATSTVDKPAWVDLSTTNPKAAREFYAKVFAWDIEVSADPQCGGYFPGGRMAILTDPQGAFFGLLAMAAG